MIILQHLSKSYGAKVLFEDISLNINQGEKIGLIGPNGAGKTTLFSLLRAETEPSAGEVKVNKQVSIGYLAQEANFSSSRTVLSELTEGDERIMVLKKEKAALEEKNEASSRRYGEVLHALEVSGYFELEHKAEKILAGLGFKQKDFQRPIVEMSGGWRMRALLGKLLTYHYDLLLLDEPTNYLDLNAALWLKGYLAAFKGTFIMISHDKAFLTEVTNYTLILENGSIAKVQGNYDHYEQIKKEKRIFLLKQYREQEKKIQQLQRFVERFHAQPNKAASVRAKRRVLERMQEQALKLPEDPGESIGDFRFPATRRSGHKILTLEKISKAYKDIQVYKDFDFEITQGTRAVLAGENGAGKSTLLKILAGVLEINGGKRIVGHNVDIGYFSQTRLDVLSAQNTVLQEAYSAAAGYMAEDMLRAILGAFLFTGDDAHKKVHVLSGGEKSRLILAKLLINPPNFLLLDEPTTHLDVDAVEALVRALSEYEGTIVFISHDIYFVRSIANCVFEVKGGNVRQFPGSFDYYLEKRDSIQEAPDIAKKAQAHEQKRTLHEERQKLKEEERGKREEERKRKTHNAALRDRIVKMEKEKEQLQLESYAKARSLSSPRFYQDEERAKEYGRRMKEIEKRITDIEDQIKTLEAKMM